MSLDPKEQFEKLILDIRQLGGPGCFTQSTGCAGGCAAKDAPRKVLSNPEETSSDGPGP
jgi:uncharacterized protein (DUF779 family)